MRVTERCLLQITTKSESFTLKQSNHNATAARPSNEFIPHVCAGGNEIPRG